MRKAWHECNGQVKFKLWQEYVTENSVAIIAKKLCYNRSHRAREWIHSSLLSALLVSNGRMDAACANM